MAETPLGIKMRALAREGHPRAEELRSRANAFDEACSSEAMAQPDGLKKMMGAWARARRLWCEVSGEPLV